MKKNIRIFIVLVMIIVGFSGVVISAEKPESGPTIHDEQMPAEALSAKEKEGTADTPEEDSDAISLDLKGVNIVEIFKILSLKTGVTIVPSKQVAGRINIFLNNVKFEEALDIILLSQDLASEKRGNIIYVMTAAEYQKMYGRTYLETREFASLKLKHAPPGSVFAAISEVKSDIGKIIVDEASGTILLIDTPEKLILMKKIIAQLDIAIATKTFNLNYADPEKVSASLADIITPGSGKIIVDNRSSKIIVSDQPAKLAKISEIIKSLDDPEREVFIEAEIVQVNLSDQYQRGIDWERFFSEKKLDGLDFVTKAPLTAAASTYGQVAIGTLADNNYNMVLTFMQDYGNVETLSRPKIAVVNNQEAKIMVGKRDAYVTQALSQTDASTVTSESIEFIDVGVKLNVTPTINDDGFVILRIKPEVSSVADIITTTLGSRIPIIETAEAETVVKVKDGTMIMIAGLIKEELRRDLKGIPVLSSIPVFGAFFGSKNKQLVKTELIVFITPWLITGESPPPGTEPEKWIPQKLMPEQVRKNIIKRELKKIKPGVLNSTTNKK